jgi:hypothetical protein
MQSDLVRAVIMIIRNTHRHPVNRALHCIGAPFYAVGFTMVLGHFAGFDSSLVAGAALWLAAVVMFVAGHTVEKNVGSMTPVLILKLVSRKVARYSIPQRIHFLRI